MADDLVVNPLEPAPEDDLQEELPPIDFEAEANPLPYPGGDHEDGLQDSELEYATLPQMPGINTAARPAPIIVAPFTPLQAGERAKDEHYHPSRSWFNDCQLFVRTRYGVGGLYGSATYAYYGTNHRHTSWPPPYGAPLWWTGGAGHTAFSLGDGTCWTNDFLRAGKIDRVNIKAITVNWRKPYHGWSEDINEVRVLNPATFIDLSNTIYAAKNSRSVKNGDKLKRAVGDEVGRGKMVYTNSVLGNGCREQFKKLQIKWYGKGDGIPGVTSMTRLSRKHGLTLIP